MEDDPAPEAPVPDVTGRMVEFGAPAGPGGEPVRVPMDRLRGRRAGGRLRRVGDGADRPPAAGPGHRSRVALAAGRPGRHRIPGAPGHRDRPVDPDSVPLTFSHRWRCPRGCPLPAHLALAGSLLEPGPGRGRAAVPDRDPGTAADLPAAGWEPWSPGGPAAWPNSRTCATCTAPARADRPVRLRPGHPGPAARQSWTRGSNPGWTGGRAVPDRRPPATPADLSELLRRRVVLATQDLAAADRTLVTPVRC